MLILSIAFAAMLAVQPPQLAPASQPDSATTSDETLPIEDVALTNAKLGGSPKPAGLNEDGKLKQLMFDTKPETIAGWSAAERREAERYLQEQARLRAAAGPRTIAQAVAAGDSEAVSRLGGTMGDYLRASVVEAEDPGTRERILSGFESSSKSFLDEPAPAFVIIPRSVAELEARLRGE